VRALSQRQGEEGKKQNNESYIETFQRVFSDTEYILRVFFTLKYFFIFLISIHGNYKEKTKKNINLNFFLCRTSF
jgi:hypothetical protein